MDITKKEQVQKLDQINLDPLPLIEQKRSCKPKPFKICPNFTKVSLKVRAWVISPGLIIFFLSIRDE